MTAQSEYPPYPNVDLFDGQEYKDYISALWSWRDKYENTCEGCFRPNLEVFCCPSDDYSCTYCCGGDCGEHEAYDYEETNDY